MCVITSVTEPTNIFSKDRMECVYEIFCYGAGCNIGDINEDTPLDWAVHVGIDGMCVITLVLGS